MQDHLQEVIDRAALYIVPEREIEGFDHYGPGISLAHADQNTLNSLCRTLRVAPLSSFFSQDSDALSGHLRYEGYALPDLPKLTWFSAAAGLKTVQALAEHLEAHPDTLDNQDEIIRELREYEFVLARFDKERIRWYMSAGF
jgi:hypothetical protein